MLSKPEVGTEKKELDLDDIYGDDALAWVKQRNDEIDREFSSSTEFKQIEKISLDIFENKDKIHYPYMDNGYLYNFLKDKDHKQGMWRRTTFDEYRKNEPIWEELLDIDALPEQDIWRSLTDPAKHTNPSEHWVYKKSHLCHPKGRRALIELSLGGGDRSVYREFDIETKQFVKDGFQVREGKSIVTWNSEDMLWVATDFGEGSLTKSGYPKIVKLWKRGEPLSEAKTVFSGEDSDVGVSAHTAHTSVNTYHCVSRYINRSENQRYFINMHDLSLTPNPMPLDAKVEDFFNHQAIIRLNSDWNVPNGPRYALGSVVALDITSITDPEHLRTSLIFAPTSTCFVQNVSSTKSHLILKLLNNVCVELHQFELTSKGWGSKRIPLPELGNANLVSSEDESDNCFISYTNFLIPTSLYYFDGTTESLELLKTAPTTFCSDQMVAKQLHATSKDATSINYFIIHGKNLVYDETNPTLLYGYGGFEHALLPSYIAGNIGKFWLEEGGVYVIANIRGGSEFGPAWHKAAINENRHKAFEDFIAVAEDIIHRKITSPKHLGIFGSSNGGLLVGAVAMQRPELFNAVICSNPLLDMLKYHTMLAGHSWMAEYGDPDNPAMRDIIKSYSPYHNVSEGKKYPPILFTSSTKDDRVHPGHARRMVEKMQSMGHEVYYYENTEGGHHSSAIFKEHAFLSALRVCYLNKQLRPALSERLRQIYHPETSSALIEAHTFFTSTRLTNAEQATIIEILETITDRFGWKMTKDQVAWIQCKDFKIANEVVKQLSPTESAIIKVSRRADKTAYIVQCQVMNFTQFIKDLTDNHKRDSSPGSLA